MTSRHFKMAASRLQDFVKTSRKIIAVGRNYILHATELGNPVPKEPLLFLKPVSSFVEQGGSIEVPDVVKELHYEVELGVIISSNGRDIPVSKAMDYVGGYTLALDMTSRDIQSVAKKNGHPWSVAKGYDTFCPVSPFIEKERINLETTKLWLKVDGELKQNGITGNMIFTVPYIISYISKIMSLQVGDVILTGTPEGVGPVTPGSVITAGIEGVIEMSFPVIKRGE